MALVQSSPLRRAIIKPPKNVLELPLLERVEMAMKVATEQVIEEHMREGLPLYVWRDGKVVAVPPEELRAHPAVIWAQTKLGPFTVPYSLISLLLYFFVCLLKSRATLSRSLSCPRR
jgi:hypothetical protein